MRYMTLALPQVYCVFLFMSSAFLFGILVSQINEIVSAKQVKTKELDNILDAYLSINPRRALLLVDPCICPSLSFFAAQCVYLYIAKSKARHIILPTSGWI